ncbi:hypothetical protein NEFER03_1419 [Nematocida sp. LUAm3]|nr:hypothetical protein NEFER03_1419 [Nematocida sp. LUAm3]KAI5174751.1 hypothetical protein NEFER02_0861 [Nematocida sp. LUAm2]KAI5177838.1 hypothetical protein NEFER01_1040 [Nematocida sp. LUAm1]
MSKFFADLGEEETKKIQRKISRDEEESEEEKQVVSNKDKKLEEIRELTLCSLKKPKEIETFFKSLAKYNGIFLKEGLPVFLLDFLNSVDEKKAPSVFKQRKSKFLEKYKQEELCLEVEKEEKKKSTRAQEINDILLVEDAERKEYLLREIESSSLSKCEAHRVNMYLLGCLVEKEMKYTYNEVVDRLCREEETNQIEENLLPPRAHRYVRRMLMHIQKTARDKGTYTEELNGLIKVSEKLKKITDTPEKAVYEVLFFLKRTEKESPYKDIELLRKIRSLPYAEALELYREEAEEIGEEATTENIFKSKTAEELGERAFMERDFETAISLLEKAYFSRNIWSDARTDHILSVLSLCFERTMREKRYFEHFKREVMGVGKNLLLLRTEDPKEEIHRAFILLRLGEYLKCEEIIKGIFPFFECKGLLRTRSLELLFSH